MAPCDAFLLIGSMLSSSVNISPGGEGQCRERLGRHPHMSTCHFSPGWQHSCLSFAQHLCCIIFSQRNKEARKVHTNSDCSHHP